MAKLSKTKTKPENPLPVDPGADVPTLEESGGAGEQGGLVSSILADVPYSQIKRLASAVGRVLGDHPLTTAVQEVERENQPEPRGRQTTAPVCPIHNKPMVAQKTEQFFTRYACPAAGCTERRKQPRPMKRHAGRPEPDFSAR